MEVHDLCQVSREGEADGSPSPWPLILVVWQVHMEGSMGVGLQLVAMARRAMDAVRLGARARVVRQQQVSDA